MISGKGSIMKAIVAACDSGQLNANVTTVISSQPRAGFQLTKGWCDMRGIACYHNRKDFYEHDFQWESVLGSLIALSNPDLVCLAGYMSVLPEGIVSQYEGRMINIHPSLLPKYKGLVTHRRALENGDSTHGATVHYVIPELDSGPIISQKSVFIYELDNEIILRDRVRSIEHELYVSSIKTILEEGVDKHYKSMI